jgi:hypothetical protein
MQNGGEETRAITMSNHVLLGSKMTTGIGRRVLTTPPTLGMKLSKNARRPKTSAKSTLSNTLGTH